jgi:hypothetical protein
MPRVILRQGVGWMLWSMGIRVRQRPLIAYYNPDRLGAVVLAHKCVAEAAESTTNLERCILLKEGWRAN